MKKFIALLCTLCMIATMVPFSASAEGETVHSAWYCANAEDILNYNGLKTGGFVSLVPNDGKDSTTDHAYVNEGLGGKAADDYYLWYDYSSGTDLHPNYLLYGLTKDQTERKANFFAIKYNVFGDEGALYPQLRISGTVKPNLYTFSATDKLLFKAGVWNTVMIVVDTNNNQVWAYVNGQQTHIADVSNIPPQSNASYTKLNQVGIDRIMLNGQGVNAKTKKMIIDDIVVVSSSTEIVPTAVNVTSTGVAYGDYIVAPSAISDITSADNTVIVYNGTDATRAATTASTGNVVCVEANDATYGKVYVNYTVESDIRDKSWDGAAVDKILGYTPAGLTSSVVTDNIGGKINDSYGAFTATASGECVIYGAQSYSTRYFALSINAYGKAIYDIFPRIDGAIKPSVVATAAQGKNFEPMLEDGIWNHVFFVFDSFTKDMKTYVNGVLKADMNLYDILESDVYKCTVDRSACTATLSGKTYGDALLSLKTDLRIRMANGKTSYLDDGAVLYTNFEPKPYVVSADVAVTGGSVSGDIIKFDNDTASVTANASTVVVNSGATWSETNSVRSGDKVYIVTTTPYGNVYSKPYSVIGGDYTQTIATMDTMSFIQGGYPWVTDENGENGYNVKPTGAGNDVLLTDIENVWGSGIDMKVLSVGYNFKNSTQTYYETSWKKAQVEQYCDYLVLEADVAFPAEEHVSGFGMSTSSGIGISTKFAYNADLAHRVNHYMWVYDIAEGKYVDYINGVALVNEPVAVDATFADGSKSAIRFTANGSTKMTDVTTTGQYTETLKAYMGNVKVYGAASAPEVVKAPVLAGAVGRYYPIYDTSEFTLDYIKSQVTGADNVIVYKNKACADKLENGTDKASYYYMIVAENDGVYSYYRVCQMTSADSKYALESFTTNANGGYSAMAINIGETTDMALTFAEKTATDDFVKCSSVVVENVPYAGAVGITINNVASNNTATLFVWDSYENLEPLGDTLSAIKK